jgi:hypothetical protein
MKMRRAMAAGLMSFFMCLGLVLVERMSGLRGVRRFG